MQPPISVWAISRNHQKFPLTISPFWFTYRLVGMRHRIESVEWPETKRRLVDTGVSLMRSRGFNATTLDDICAAAVVTKGGFFHYCKSKDEHPKDAPAQISEAKARACAQAAFHK